MTEFRIININDRKLVLILLAAERLTQGVVTFKVFIRKDSYCDPLVSLQ